VSVLLSFFETSFFVALFEECMADASNSESGNIVTQTRNYFVGSVEELKKISKPTRQEATQFTIIAVFIICFIAVCLMLIDLIFRQIMSALLA